MSRPGSSQLSPPALQSEQARDTGNQLTGVHRLHQVHLVSRQ